MVLLLHNLSEMHAWGKSGNVYTTGEHTLHSLCVKMSDAIGVRKQRKILTPANKV